MLKSPTPLEISGPIATTHSSNPNRKLRPLSSSASSFNLSAPVVAGDTPRLPSVAVYHNKNTKSRALRIEESNKENVLEEFVHSLGEKDLPKTPTKNSHRSHAHYSPTKESRSSSHTPFSISSVHSASIGSKPSRALKSRSSAPNLSPVKASNVNKSLLTRGHRSLMYLNGIVNVQHRERDEEVLLDREKTKSRDSLGVEYNGRISPPSSQSLDLTPDSVNTVDSLLDQTSIQFIDLENTTQELVDDDNISYTTTQSSGMDETVVEENDPKEVEALKLNIKAKKIHRTNNSYNINEFMKIINNDQDIETNKLPISNRRSLELETQERKNLENLLNSEIEIVHDESLASHLSLVENGLFLTVREKKPNNQLTFIEKLMEDIDYKHLLKEESYDFYDSIGDGVDNLVLRF